MYVLPITQGILTLPNFFAVSVSLEIIARVAWSAFYVKY